MYLWNLKTQLNLFLQISYYNFVRLNVNWNAKVFFGSIKSFVLTIAREEA